MKLSALINQDCSKAAVLFNSKKRVLEYISELAHQQLPDVSKHSILDALMAREKLGSTGIGKGIAIPHGRMDGLNETLAMILVNQKAIAFEAIDNRPVDIFVALLVPDGHDQDHLATLSAIAEKFTDKTFCKQLRQADSDEELYNIVLAAS